MEPPGASEVTVMLMVLPVELSTTPVAPDDVTAMLPKSSASSAGRTSILTSDWMQHAKSNAREREQIDFKKLNKFSTATFQDVR